MHPVKLATMARLAPALAAAARLGIADHLDGETLSYGDLAKAVDAHPDALLRLLRILAAVGIFEESATGEFRNSEDSRTLQSSNPRSVRNVCVLLGEMYHESWSALLHTVKTGESAAKHALGKPMYEYMRKNPEAAEVFDQAMEEMTRPVAAELANSYDFRDAQTVVDIGGGNGALLKGVMSAYPHLRGVSVDREDVCSRSEGELRESGDMPLLSRLRFSPADFIESVPDGGDVYVLKNVLHDWNEVTGVRILENARNAMMRTAERQRGRFAKEPRLLIIEPFVDEVADAAGRALAYMAYMVIGEDGARGHTESGLRRQLENARLKVLSAMQLTTGHWVLECGVA
ncbi:O-methyltransferase [Streptomyces sp. 2333.5]|uniref:methyltransferase n=1 Tax=Streptomyces sp. 2314.4 TaxID=1881025 RepID=UPI000898FF35|nr:methyltransferase [Streptomyces sp. 2314.4]PJJ04998.1 O-methyltransferase [Streptomyces sp. 2333.5]SEE65649.1 O-methyltransferase [Streptomyces sp. 2314.4]SEE92136.1 O-methyltransferase [Streptomyces sp. 2112.2]